jgi:hypothetical protein
MKGAVDGESSSKSKEFVVFSIIRDSTCAECGEELWKAPFMEPRSCRHCEPSPHFCPWNNARSLCDDYSPAQEHEIRNRLNPKLSGESRVFLRIDLED